MSNRISHAGTTAVNNLLRLRTLMLLGIFTIADLFAGLLHILRSRGMLSSRFFRLARDRGFAELIQYGKFALIILMLIRWNRLRKAKVLTAWLILFAVMLADDSIGLHEEIGAWLVGAIEFPAIEGVRAKDLAEAVAFAMLEGCACLYVLLRYFQAPRDLRAYSRGLVLAMIPLVFAGLLLDILPFHALEQPGEMAAMSILLGFVHWKYRHEMQDASSDRSESGEGQ